MPKITKHIDATLRAALAKRLETISLRAASDAIGQVDGRPIIAFGTLADYNRGHPADRPHMRSHINVEQAEALAKYLGLTLEITKKAPSKPTHPT
ncbi:MAG: hypothetical protein RL513_100 [Pseudomonadota bacterium]|jgi:hypothetical protein